MNVCANVESWKGNAESNNLLENVRERGSENGEFSFCLMKMLRKLNEK